MNTLITGGFGFLGTHLTEELLAHNPEGHIHIVDNMSTSIVDHEQFLDGLGNPSNVSYEIGDMKNYVGRRSEHFDRVYHLASVVGPAGVLPHAGKIAGSIIYDAELVAEAAMQRGARLLNVSTSEIYGGGHSSENDPKIIPAETTVRLEYAIGKLAAEIALTNTHKARGLDVVIVRPFNIAGPRQSAEGGFVLPRFAAAALNDEPLTVFGDGTQVRAFTHVADMSRGIRLAMEKGHSGEVYNIGDYQNRTTINELASRLIALANSKSVIEYVDPTTIYGALYADANDKLPNAKRAKRELDWSPQRSLDDIIIDTLDWVATK